MMNHEIPRLTVKLNPLLATWVNNQYNVSSSLSTEKKLNDIIHLVNNHYDKLRIKKILRILKLRKKNQEIMNDVSSNLMKVNENKYTLTKIQKYLITMKHKKIMKIKNMF